MKRMIHQRGIDIMRIRNFLIAAIFFLPLFNGKICAEETKKILSYEDYITEIERALPEIKSNSIALLQAENSIKKAKGESDISLSAGGEGFYGDQYSGTQSGLKQGYSWYGGAEKKFKSTGTTVSHTYSYSKNSYSGYSTFDDYTTYQPSLSVRVTQPLLYNFLGKVDQYSEKNAKMQLEIEKLKLSENNRNLLKSYSKLYFQWIAYSEILNNLEEAVKNSRVMKNQTLRKVKAGLADNDDYQKSATSLLSYEKQYREYKELLKNTENQLSVYFDISSFKPDITLYEKWFREARDYSYNSVAFEKTTSAKVIEETMKNFQYSKGVYENMLLPQFNIFAEAVRKDISEEASYGMNDSDYSFGFEFTYRIGNNSAEGALKDVEIEIKSLALEYESALNEYTKSMLSLQESAAGTRDILTIQEEQIKALNSQIATEKKKYLQARLNLSYLIETENNLSSGITSLINYKYELISSYIEYMDLTN